MNIIQKIADVAKRANNAVIGKAEAYVLSACQREVDAIEKEIAEREARGVPDDPLVKEAKADLARLKAQMVRPDAS